MRVLDDLAEASGARDLRRLRVIAIVGAAGIGKTALAVRWANTVAHKFPDGQLHLNLHGYDRHPTMSSVDALSACLRAHGVPDKEIPTSEDNAAALYRSVLAGRRVLIVLDVGSERTAG